MTVSRLEPTSRSNLSTHGRLLQLRIAPSMEQRHMAYCAINGTTTHGVNLKIYIADFEASFVPLRCVHCFTKTKDLGVSFVSVFWKRKPPRVFGLVFLENGEQIRKKKNPEKYFLVR